MKSFPDTRGMERSKDGTEPVRGGSIGLNRILGRFEERGGVDRKPEFNAVLVSAYTVFRNIWGMSDNHSIENLETLFVKDVNLLLQYYDIYLSGLRFSTAQKSPVVVYFPNYHRVDPKLMRELKGNNLELANAYEVFRRRNGTKDARVRDTDYTFCTFVGVGSGTYPHVELVGKLKSIATSRDSAYTVGDPVAIISHIPLDLHISGRLRSVMSLESYTGELKTRDQFGTKLDREGRVPFLPAAHVILGDQRMIRPMVSHGLRKKIFEHAAKEKWTKAPPELVTRRIIALSEIPVRDILKYDFS